MDNKQTITIKIDSDLKKKLKIISVKKDIPISKILNKLIEKYVEIAE